MKILLTKQYIGYQKSSALYTASMETSTLRAQGKSEAEAIGTLMLNHCDTQVTRNYRLPTKV